MFPRPPSLSPRPLFPHRQQIVDTPFAPLVHDAVRQAFTRFTSLLLRDTVRLADGHVHAVRSTVEAVDLRYSERCEFNHAASQSRTLHPSLISSIFKKKNSESSINNASLHSKLAVRIVFSILIIHAHC
jgi:hypothetical protein